MYRTSFAVASRMNSCSWSGSTIPGSTEYHWVGACIPAGHELGGSGKTRIFVFLLWLFMKETI